MNVNAHDYDKTDARLINTTEEEKQHFIQKPKCYVPARFVLVVLIHMGLFICYSLRVNLSIAIISMTEQAGWSKSEKGIVLSAFFWGYIIPQVPGGFLASKYGGKIVFGAGVLWASVFTIVTPLTINYLPIVVVCRIITGFGESVTYPTVHHLIASWFPVSEKSGAVTFAWAGSYLGTVVTMWLSPHIVNHPDLGWEFAFYCFGIAGGIWFILWMLFTASTPNDASAECMLVPMTAYEKHYILTTRGETKELQLSEIPWMSLLTSIRLWAIIVNHFCANWNIYVIMMWLPSFMKNSLHYDLSKAGVASFIPFLTLFLVSLIVGVIADIIIHRKLLSLTWTRKVFQAIGLTVPALFLLLLSFQHISSPTIAVVYMTISVGFIGATLAGYGPNHMDLDPKYAGIMFGITNTVATIPGIVGVYLVGPILDHSHHNWSIVWLIAAGIDIFGCIFWLLFATGEPVDFDNKYKKTLEI